MTGYPTRFCTSMFHGRGFYYFLSNYNLILDGVKWKKNENNMRYKFKLKLGFSLHHSASPMHLF